jgi:hypothetical protein
MIEEFWIINAAGVPLFYQSTKSGAKDDSLEAITKSTLFAGMWSAINSFAQQIDGTSISSIHLGTNTLTLKKSESFNLIFTVKAPRDVKDKQVNKILAKLMESFLENYSTILPSWTGNIGDFSSFHQEVNKVIHASYPEKFQRSLAEI